MAADPQLNELERSLINFLMSKKDLEAVVPGGLRRLRGLTFNIVFDKNQKAYFSVQIGMSEALFSTINGVKERGSCYNCEKHIRTWFEKGDVSAGIKNYISQSNKGDKK